MKRILIVEDEPDIQELLRAYLEDAGYQTAVAGDGVAALALFGGQTFDLDRKSTRLNSSHWW